MELYYKDAYLKNWETSVKSVKNNFVTLNETAFYPRGGGQPCDEGTIKKGNDEFNVLFVGKFEGKVSHELDKTGLKEGDTVYCEIDWQRRHKLMRMHTAMHVLSAVFASENSAKITGGDLGVDKSRADFGMENFTKELVESYVSKANELLKKNAEVKQYFISAKEAKSRPELVRLEKGMLEGLEEYRVVEIVGIDTQLDGGLHVKNTSEVGEIEMIKIENKGAGRKRLYFTVK